MPNSYYDIECTDEELRIFTVLKKATGDKYYLTLTDDGKWIHTCKARLVYGDDFKCRHIKMIIQKFLSKDEFKHLFNITPKRKTVSTEQEET